MLSEIEDQVLVGFVGDNSTSPYVIGSIWSQNQQPPLSEVNSGADLNNDGGNNLRFLKSRSGNMILFDDTDGAENFNITTSGQTTNIEFDVAAELLTIQTDVDTSLTGAVSILMECEDISLEAENTIAMTGANILIESTDGNVNETASSAMNMEGGSVTLN